MCVCVTDGDYTLGQWFSNFHVKDPQINMYMTADSDLKVWTTDPHTRFVFKCFQKFPKTLRFENVARLFSNSQSNRRFKVVKLILMQVQLYYYTVMQQGDLRDHIEDPLGGPRTPL